MSDLERVEQELEHITVELERWTGKWETKAQHLATVESNPAQRMIGGETMAAGGLAALRDEMTTIGDVIAALEVEQGDAQRMVMLAQIEALQQQAAGLRTEAAVRFKKTQELLDELAAWEGVVFVNPVQLTANPVKWPRTARLEWEADRLEARASHLQALLGWLDANPK
jgi:hypothetical protein